MTLPELPGWMIPIHGEILTLFNQNQTIRLSSVVVSVNIDYHRNYTNTRLNDLAEAGILYKDERVLYSLTPFGKEFLNGKHGPMAVLEGPPYKYIGKRHAEKENDVLANDIPLEDRINPLDRDINPDWGWGYESRSAYDLGFALLADFSSGKVAASLFEPFTEEFILPIDDDDEWEIYTGEIGKFVEERT